MHHVSLHSLYREKARDSAIVGHTYLALNVAALIVAVGGSTERGSWLVPSSDTTALCKVFLTLRPADLDLLLFTAAAEFVRLEGALCLERRATVLGDVLVGHFCDSRRFAVW
jgi:hypothetical protein